MAVRIFMRAPAAALLGGLMVLGLGAGGAGQAQAHADHEAHGARDGDHGDAVSATHAGARTPGEVFLSPTCGCCKEWVEHMQDNGFDLTVTTRDAMQPVKSRLGVPSEMQSCHTAVIDGYVIEGHVPADDVRRLLDERPDGTGIATPGMPIGSPGMEYKNQSEPYDVVLFGDGQPEVFEHHP